MDAALSPLAAALAYAAEGWPVLPVAGIAGGNCTCRRSCDSPGKHPLVRHGVRDAATEATQIRQWWLRWPAANVGIATGGRSGVAVVDVDPHRGGRKSLRDLDAGGLALPRTLRAATGGGGFHLYYRQPAGLVFPNTVDRLPNVAGNVAGVDLRGDGGYVVAPPSVHASGHAYRWSARQPEMPAVLPAWMWPPPPPPRPVVVLRHPRHSGASPYGAAALANEVAAVRRLAVGQRNDGLNRAAFSLGTLVAGGELDELVVAEELVAAALAVGLRDREAQATVRSGLRAGAGAPRTAPTAPRPAGRNWRSQP